MNINLKYKLNILKKMISNYHYYKWWKDDGENTLLTKYNLDKNSIVFELGGYNGTFSKQILDKFDCKLVIFEPSKEYYDKLKKIFENKNVQIFNYGLSDFEGSLSLIAEGEKTYLTEILEHDDNIVEVKKLSDFIIQNNFFINLLNINIEGSEYKVLNDLLDTGTIHNIENLQIQFHKNVKNYRKKKRLLKNSLSKTHHLVWKYDYVWESWKKL